MNYIALVLLVSVVLGIPDSSSEDEWQLELVQILFRNGISAPEELYPNDPNNQDAWVEGLGQVTLAGQKQLFNVGKELRSRYKHFLSSNPHELKVQSTYLDKCMSSALCMMASLYEPDETWEFMPGLRWQPIPVFYTPPHEDKLLGSTTNFEIMNKQLILEAEKELKKYEKQLQYWTTFSGMTVKNCTQVSNLYKILSTEYISNHTIPEWAWRYWEDMANLNNFCHKVAYTANSTLRSFGGPLLVQMVKNVINKGIGKLDKKIYIYSVQSAHVASLLGAINSFNNKEPPFAATIVMEMLKKRSQDATTDFEYGIKMSYFNGTGSQLQVGEPKTLIFPGCTEVCPLEAVKSHARQFKKTDWE